MSDDEEKSGRGDDLVESISAGRRSYASSKKTRSRRTTEDDSIIVTIDSTPKKKKFSLMKRTRDSVVTAGSDRAEEITEEVAPTRKSGVNFVLQGGALVYAQPFWLHNNVNVKKFDKMLRRVDIATELRFFYPYETVLHPNVEFPIEEFNTYCRENSMRYGEKRKPGRHCYEWCFEGLPPSYLHALPINLSKVYTAQIGSGRNTETTIRYDPATNYVEVSLSCEVTLEVKGDFGKFPIDKHSVTFAYNLNETHVAFEDHANLAFEAQNTEKWAQAEDTDYFIHTWFCDEIRVRDGDLDAYNAYFPTTVDLTVARLFKLAVPAPEYIDSYFISLQYTLFRTGQSPELKLALENSGNNYIMLSMLPVFAIVFVLLMSTHQSFVISSQSRAELYVLPFFGVIGIHGIKSLVAMEYSFVVPSYHLGEIHALFATFVLVFSPIITAELPQLNGSTQVPFLGFTWLGIHLMPANEQYEGPRYATRKDATKTKSLVISSSDESLY